MGIYMPQKVKYHAKQVMRRQLPFSAGQQCHCQESSALPVPKGHFAVYVGDEEEKQHFVIPISYLKHPLFQELLRKAEKTLATTHGIGGIVVPCSKYYFIDLVSLLKYS
ncbi:hypothetical protein Nepgr_004656 [Nepenthes gracilis]|uniref:Uncharacterized protein n=1 Tax=Nepenthes gracilis TaxID=150966 RepID=A0AAD3XFJ7_NEPGR|nr:hypothetical protein Nepgr_004656 [Nepenthes gracilis]